MVFKLKDKLSAYLSLFKQGLISGENILPRLINYDRFVFIDKYLVLYMESSIHIAQMMVNRKPLAANV